MSHWVTYKNDILKNTDIPLLKTALKDIGCIVHDDVKEIRNSWGNADVDFAFSSNEIDRTSLGFKEVMNNGNKELELRGDFFATGLSQNSFMDTLTQKYQEKRITRELEKNQWYVDNNKVDEEGNIIIDAYQYVY